MNFPVRVVPRSGRHLVCKVCIRVCVCVCDGLPSLVNQPDMRDSHERLGRSSDPQRQSAAVTSLEGHD